MITVTISQHIASEYATRGLWTGCFAHAGDALRFADATEISGPGRYLITNAQAREMAADADWYAHPDGPNSDPEYVGSRRAYRALAAQIRKRLSQ